MDKKGWSGSLALLLAAMIWGGSFVAQAKGLELMPPIAYNGIRFMIGTTVLFPIVVIRRKQHPEKLPALHRENILGSMFCGVFLAVASSVQQFGLLYTTAGKSAFVTTLYVVFVPLIGLFLKKRIGIRGWIGTFMAAVGLFFLCVTEELSINRGDVITLFCALTFAFHILAVDRFSPQTDGLELSMIQFFTAGVICLAYTLAAERVTVSQILSCRWMLLYSGALSCGVAYTAQVIGQKHTPPALASLLMCLESVFAAIFGWMLLGEVLSEREWLGCILMFSAIVISQLPVQHRGTQKKLALDSMKTESKGV